MIIRAIATPVSIAALAACTPFSSGDSFGDSFGSSNSPTSSYCVAQPLICALLGIVVVGGVLVLADGGGGSSGSSSSPSDTALKTNLQPVTTLENGIRLYAFQFLGDSRTFVGVQAQELAADPRFAYAVSRGVNGFLEVDYGALGLQLEEAEQMLEAGQAAAVRLGSL